jgi:chromosome partitioning protein
MNAAKIEKIEEWIQISGEYLEALKEFSNENVTERRYKGEEAATAVGVSLSSIYKAEKNGRLPAPELNDQNRRKGYTLQQIIDMQGIFGTSPFREEYDEPVTISFLNFKGGVTKSTTSLYAGSYYAHLGFRVLLVDLDAQGSLTNSVGIMPDRDTSFDSTLAPYIIGSEGFTKENVSDVILKTYLPNMHILPACLELAGIEFVLSRELSDARQTGNMNQMLDVFERVKEALELVKQDYDIIILDGTPSLSLIPLNIIMAADHIISPVPTEPTDFASTRSFLKLYLEQITILVDAFGDQITMPTINILPTRHAASEKNATLSSNQILEMIRDIFGGSCFDHVIRKHESVVSNLSFYRRSVFDINAGDCNISRDARKKAINNYKAVFDELLEKLIYPNWESKKEMLQDRGAF